MYKRQEIIVGWRVSMDLQALAVYSLEPDGARELMPVSYTHLEQLCFDTVWLQSVKLAQHRLQLHCFGSRYRVGK